MANMEYVHTEDDDDDLDDGELSLKQLKDAVEDAYTNSMINRRQAADDLVFYNVTQWDDNLLSGSDLSYRGQFDILAKAVRQTIAELRANPVQIQFHPIDETTDDQADFIDGIYRTDDNANFSQEAYAVSEDEAIKCGYGAYEIYTEYENSRSKNKKQVLKRAPINEANNMTYWDPQSRMMDKSDAMWIGILYPYSHAAYKELLEQFGEEDDKSGNRKGDNSTGQNFLFPEQSYTFPWVAGNYDWVYVCTFYNRTKIDEVIVTMQDPFGQTKDYYRSDLEEIEDKLYEEGHIVINTKECERWIVRKYIATGEKILSCEIIACDFIPVVPVYGERAFVEGQETWRGLVRLAKDPQRLRNFVLSYWADIASRSARPKPMFFPAQIQGFEPMYSESGASNNYPFYYINQKDLSGNDLPLGPAGTMPEQKVPDAMLQLAQLTREAVADVASDALTRDFSDIDLSGDALAQLNNRIDQQSIIFQENRKHSRRRDAEIAASFYSRIYDIKRDVLLTKHDGTRIKDQAMKDSFNEESGEMETINDLTNARFEVYTTVGPSYSSQKEKVRREISTIMPVLPPDDPMRMPLMLKYFELIEGQDVSSLRKYARKQSIIGGYEDPETPEEQQWLAEAQKNKQPDAQTIAAQAEQIKGQAAMIKAQAAMVTAQSGAQHKQQMTAIDGQNSQTSRLKVAVDAKSKATDAALYNKDIELTHAHNLMALQQGKEAEPKARQVHKNLHGVVIMKHPVHGSVTESDINDTMAATGMTRERVINKLKHHSTLHKVMGR